MQLKQLDCRGHGTRLDQLPLRDIAGGAAARCVTGNSKSRAMTDNHVPKLADRCANLFARAHVAGR